MATDNEARSLGFTLPMGWEDLKQGDNAITTNAKAAVDLYRSARSYTDSAITDRARELRSYVANNRNGTISFYAPMLTPTSAGNGTTTIGD